jgi:hypothetical protein
MTGDRAAQSLLDVFLLYEKWRTRLLIYFATVVFGAGLGLILDVRFQIPPVTVLLYALPLTTVFMIAVPAAYVGFRRSALYETVRQLILGVPWKLVHSGYPAGKYASILEHGAPGLTNAAARRRLKRLEASLARIWEETEALAEITTVDEEIQSKLGETKPLLTTVRLRQLDLRLRQSGISAQTKLVLDNILKGLRAIAQREVEMVPAEASKDFRSGFEKGLDAASAALFAQIAVILAEESFRNEKESYPQDNPSETLKRLAQQELLWLFKYEGKP